MKFTDILPALLFILSAGSLNMWYYSDYFCLMAMCLIFFYVFIKYMNLAAPKARKTPKL